MRSLKEGLDLLIPRGAPEANYARRPVEQGDMMGRDFQKAVDAAVALQVARAVAAEREACIAIATEIDGTVFLSGNENYSSLFIGRAMEAHRIAEAIRDRGGK